MVPVRFRPVTVISVGERSADSDEAEMVLNDRNVGVHCLDLK
tara:strand:- start:729 stop:854 length:126 start_codon:yes stop_codon:yes gene_type:complete